MTRTHSRPGTRTGSGEDANRGDDILSGFLRVELVFQSVPGVTSTEVGCTHGAFDNATYEESRTFAPAPPATTPMPGLA